MVEITQYALLRASRLSARASLRVENISVFKGFLLTTLCVFSNMS